MMAIAGDGTAMERDYEFSSKTHAADLDAPAHVGKVAGERTVKRANPRKVSTRKVPDRQKPNTSEPAGTRTALARPRPRAAMAPYGVLSAARSSTAPGPMRRKIRSATCVAPPP